MNVPGVIALGKQQSSDGLYFHVRYNDHAVLTRLLAERRLRVDGLILDARCHERHKVLRQEANRARITTCLDSHAMELAMPGTSSKGHAALPWALRQPHRPQAFTADYSARLVDALVTRAVEGEYTAVMSPTHYLAEEGSAWLNIDRELAVRVRSKLNANSLGHAYYIYPLALHSRLFYDANFRAGTIALLKGLPIDVIALRVHPFGSDAGPHAMRNYIEACRDFRRLGIPLMVERAGFSGLAAYALGAVDLVESGIMMGDSFDMGVLQKPPKHRPGCFSPPQRIYLEALGMSIDLAVAAQLMKTSPGKVRFACKESGCCANGFTSMLDDPQRHSVLARQRQYLALSRMPSTLRANHFITTVITSICDMLSRGADIHEPLKKAHKRMLSVKETLLDLYREHDRTRQKPATAVAAPGSRPTGQVIPLTPRDSRGR